MQISINHVDSNISFEQDNVFHQNSYYAYITNTYGNEVFKINIDEDIKQFSTSCMIWPNYSGGTGNILYSLVFDSFDCRLYYDYSSGTSYTFLDSDADGRLFQQFFIIHSEAYYYFKYTYDGNILKLFINDVPLFQYSRPGLLIKYIRYGDKDRTIGNIRLNDIFFINDPNYYKYYTYEREFNPIGIGYTNENIYGT